MSSHFSHMFCKFLNAENVREGWELMCYKLRLRYNREQRPGGDGVFDCHTCPSRSSETCTTTPPHLSVRQGEFMSEYLLGCLSTPFIRHTAWGYFIFQVCWENSSNSYHPSCLLIYFNIYKICNTPKQTGSPLNHRLLAVRVSQTLSLSMQHDIVPKSLRHTNAPLRLTDQNQCNKHAA